MADIEKELQTFKNARYGEEVRDSMISAIIKINENVENDTASAKSYSDSASESLNQANQALLQVETINDTLQSVVDNATQVMNDTSAAEELRVEAENERVSAEALRESAERSYVAQAKEYMEQTKTYATSNYVTEAQSWATGGTNTRTGEDTNNAKYWAEQAASIAGGNSVLAFNGRTGIVAPTSGDYTATQITYDDSNVKDKISEIEGVISSDSQSIQSLQSLISSMQNEINTLKNKCPYEIGDSLITTNSTNPSTRYPGTSWKMEKDAFILAAGDTYKVGQTGGSSKHNHNLSDNGRAKIRNYGNKLVYMALANENDRPTLPAQAKTENKDLYGFAHNSDAKETSFNYSGVGLYGNTDDTSNLPPYIVKYIWTRTA